MMEHSFARVLGTEGDLICVHLGNAEIFFNEAGFLIVHIPTPTYIYPKREETDVVDRGGR